MSKIFISSYGCTNNRYESVLLKNNYLLQKWNITEDASIADKIIFFTCGGFKSTEDYCIKKLNEFYDINKNADIIVTGCLTKINKKLLESTFRNNRFSIIKPEEIYNILNIEKNIETINSFDEIDLSSELVDYSDINELKDIWRNKGFSYSTEDTYLRIATGCLGNCSYCAIKISQGNLKSKNIDLLIDELRHVGVDKIKHLIFIGSDCGAYGQDINTNIIVLLKAIFKLGGDFKMSFLYTSPQWLIKYSEEFDQILSTDRILYINMPIQSGSTEILSLMKRNYDIDKVKERFLTINQKFPNVLLGTGIIIGFPSESDEDFNQTIKILEEIHLNTLTYHFYTDRPNTEASKMNNKISKEIMLEREKFLRKRLEGKNGLAKFSRQAYLELEEN